TDCESLMACFFVGDEPEASQDLSEFYRHYTVVVKDIAAIPIHIPPLRDQNFEIGSGVPLDDLKGLSALETKSGSKDLVTLDDCVASTLYILWPKVHVDVNQEPEIVR
ncbi:MAG: hypothetical protein Q9183_007979, partial [Haloplaca sp. 2 TL-2023]